jgi:hypothetical protein
MAYITGTICGHPAPVRFVGDLVMIEDPKDAVYSNVERAYVRLQAGDILIRCVDEGNSTPMEHLVEELVLAGPKSLTSLREMRVEVAHRKSEVLDDLYQIYCGLERSLRSFGVQLTGVVNPKTIKYIRSAQFVEMLQDQGVLEKDDQITCMQMLNDTREIIASLKQHVDLLEEIEIYLQDWLWGLAYQMVQDGYGERAYPNSRIAL